MSEPENIFISRPANKIEGETIMRIPHPLSRIPHPASHNPYPASRIPNLIFRLAICGLLIASASQSVKAKESNSPNPSGAIFATSAADGGRLSIRRSPTLGRNVSITLRIDGKLAGTLSWGRTYDRYITPGRHILTATPSRSRGVWQGTLNVRRGETYSYTASYNVNELVLTPVSGSR